MELDPKYCDVIIKRWQDFTGKEAIHAETGEHLMADVKLTAKQEAFAQGIADGMGQADAYRTAYDATAHEGSIYVQAST
jgi:hypothetical protein